MSTCKSHAGQCSVCRQNLSLGDSIQHKCGGRTHAYHLDLKAPNFDQCPACAGTTDMNKTMVEEPMALKGVDYVKNPVPAPSKNRFIQIFSPKGNPDAPHRLLDVESYVDAPVDYLVQIRGASLQHFLQAGVKMIDFLTVGYPWSELKKFQDLSGERGEERKKRALQALEMNAEHLRDYAHLLPVKDMGLSARDVVEYFGLHFPEQCGEMMVVGGDNIEPWQARDLIQLGFVLTDLYGAGLEYLEQYAALHPRPEDDRALGMTQKELRSLPSREKQIRQAEIKQLQAEQARARVMNVQRIPREFRASPEPLVQNTMVLPREPEPEPELEAVTRRLRYHGLKKK